MTKTVLVTGGAGYIGSHACKALAEQGYEPVCFDNLIYGHEWAVQWGPLVRGDLLNPEDIRQAFETYQPVAVMHFAAYAYVGESVINPAKYYRNNVVGSLNLLEQMIAFECKRIVFSSTCATYGTPDEIPISVGADQQPINPYGTSKLMVERILRDYVEAYDLQTAVLRYFNAAGADPDGLIGESHDPETHLIPLILDVVAGNAEEISVFGQDYPTHDGTCIRDYIHVSDLADAHVRCVDLLLGGQSVITCNLGTGTGYSVLEVIQACERVCQKSIGFRLDQRRPGDPPVLVADCSSTNEMLSWHPARSDIETIVKTAWQWHQRLPR